MPTSNTRAFGAVTTRPRRIVPLAAPTVVPTVVPTVAPLVEPPAAPAAEPVVSSQADPVDEVSQELTRVEIAEPEPEDSRPEPEDEDSRPEPKFPPFAAEYNAVLTGLPPSILRSLEDRLLRKKYDLGVASDPVTAAIEKTVAAYIRKREQGRVRAAATRAAKKAAHSAEPDAE